MKTNLTAIDSVINLRDTATTITRERYQRISSIYDRDGYILLLEHVRIDHPIIGPLMDLLSPVVAHLNGASINRRTVDNVRAAGLKIDHVLDLDGMGMFKLIMARPGA
ncbi:MAG: hypothetical protein ABI621_02480 [Chloroflexota bacterium]